MTGLQLRAAGERACVLAVRAQPGARRSGVLGLWNGRVKVAVGAPPERGRANAAVIDELARALGLSRSEFTLVSGDRARHKRVRIERPAAEVERRLLALFG